MANGMQRDYLDYLGVYVVKQGRTSRVGHTINHT